MKIISRRGYWIDSKEKNTEIAFKRSISEGFGIETDVRDYNGELVVSHDVLPANKKPFSFNEFLELFVSCKYPDALLAINIKSDGIQDMLATSLNEYGLKSYFTFDMSIPSLYFAYQQTGLKIFSSVNEYIKKPIAMERCNGIWLDAYVDTWYKIEDIKSYIIKGKDVCIVSPELHGREHKAFWELIKSSGLVLHNELSLCTDFPSESRGFFF